MGNRIIRVMRAVGYFCVMAFSVLAVFVLFRENRSDQLKQDPDSETKDLPYILLPGDLVKLPQAYADAPAGGGPADSGDTCDVDSSGDTDC